MNVRELRAAARGAGISDAAFVLLGEVDERYCLTREETDWAVFYLERGRRNDERRHLDEAAACDDLLARLMRDPSTRADRRKGSR